MKTRMFFILISVSMVLLFGFCSVFESSEDKVKGLWIIEESVHKGYDTRYEYMGNFLTFKADMTCELPITGMADAEINADFGKWKILKDDSIEYLMIETPNELFNYKFRIYFTEKVYKQGSLEKIVLTSGDSVYISATLTQGIQEHELPPR